MGLELFNSKSSSTTNAPTTGSQTSNAPSSAINVSGDKAQHNVTVNNTSTDYGAVAGSLAAIDDAIFESAELGQMGVDAGTDIARQGLQSGVYVAEGGLRLAETAVYQSGDSLRDIIGFGQGILDGAAGLVRDALQEASYQTANALATAEAGVAAGQAMTRDAIDSNNAITKDSLMLSQSVVELTDDLYAESAGFLRGTMTDFTDTVVRLDDSRNKESAQTLDAITELATVVQPGGESITAHVNKLIAGIAIVTAGAIAWRALG